MSVKPCQVHAHLPPLCPEQAHPPAGAAGGIRQKPDLRVSSRERIEQATGLVLGRAQAAGVVRADVGREDLMQLIGPMRTSATLIEGQGERLLTMVLDGLRLVAASSASSASA